MNGVLEDYELPQHIIDIVIKHKISFKPLITHRFSFDETPHAIETANEMNDTKIKMVVKISQTKVIKYR